MKKRGGLFLRQSVLFSPISVDLEGKELRRTIAGVLAVLLFAAGGTCTVQADEWDKSEDGQYWMYYDYSGEPLKDEWIEENGKTYYLDSNGYMKTGWVTNKDDGNKYYMGEDGAMVKNAFTPDDKYVGPDGVAVAGYDNYRKKVKAEINKAAKYKAAANTTTNSSRNTTGKTDANKTVRKQSYFLLTDLNQDGYRDLVVLDAEVTEEENMDSVQADSLQNTLSAAGQNPENVQPGVSEAPRGALVEIAVWDSEDKEFQLAAEFDEAGEGEYSTLYLDPQGEGIWLEITENEESLRLFQMVGDTPRFNHVWDFYMELDDWGGPLYYVNGSDEDKAAWDEEMAKAKLRRGTMPLTGYLPVSDEHIKAQVDLLLTDRDLGMWEVKE